jgi:hypothetical protein
LLPIVIVLIGYSHWRTHTIQICLYGIVVLDFYVHTGMSQQLEKMG